MKSSFSLQAHNSLKYSILPPPMGLEPYGGKPVVSVTAQATLQPLLP